MSEALCISSALSIAFDIVLYACFSLLPFFPGGELVCISSPFDDTYKLVVLEWSMLST